MFNLYSDVLVTQEIAQALLDEFTALCDVSFKAEATKLPIATPIPDPCLTITTPWCKGMAIVRELPDSDNRKQFFGGKAAYGIVDIGIQDAGVITAIFGGTLNGESEILNTLMQQFADFVASKLAGGPRH